MQKETDAIVAPAPGQGLNKEIAPDISHRHVDVEHILHELKHYLPSQQALRDFIHHNSLHAFQHMKFYDAIFTASKIFGFQVHLQLPEYREMYKTGRIREEQRST